MYTIHCSAKASNIKLKIFFIISRRLYDANSCNWNPIIDKKESISFGTGGGGRLIETSLLSHKALAIRSIALVHISESLLFFLFRDPRSKKSLYYK